MYSGPAEKTGEKTATTIKSDMTKEEERRKSRKKGRPRKSKRLKREAMSVSRRMQRGGQEEMRGKGRSKRRLLQVDKVLRKREHKEGQLEEEE